MSYSGSGATTDTTYNVQQYLVDRWGIPLSTPEENLNLELSNTLTSQGANGPAVLNTFFSQYGENAHLPQDIDSFVAALINAVPPGLGFTVGVQGAQLKSVIRDSIRASLSLENSSFDQSVIAQALADPSLQPNSATFFDDVYDLAFGKFLQEFQYTGTTITNGLSPSVVSGFAVVDNAYFNDRFVDFFVKFATVVNPAGTSVNFQEIFQAFFGTNSADFQTFLANYIKSIAYPSSGTQEAFLPNEQIGAWMKKVQESYSIALSGSAAPVTSSVGESFKKVVIIDQLLRLLIKMIGTLQKVAATQSGRLRILTNWQSAYTDLQTQVPIFTQGDGTIFSQTSLASKDELQKARDQGNNYNQTVTETIRSRRTTIQDDAKILQSNLSQSNDSANDQASTITAILQTLSTILGAIYR